VSGFFDTTPLELVADDARMSPDELRDYLRTEIERRQAAETLIGERDRRLPPDERIEHGEVVDAVVVEAPERRPVDELPIGRPDAVEAAYRNPKGVLRGWFEDAKDLEDDMTKRQYRVVDADDFVRGYASPGDQPLPAGE
jgi:hypothetical protein